MGSTLKKTTDYGYLCKYYKQTGNIFGGYKNPSLIAIGDCIDIMPCKYFERRMHRKNKTDEMNTKEVGK
jgi:hypothetical protein